MATYPMVRVSVKEDGTGTETPADVRTRAEAVATDDTDKTAQDKFDEFDAHMENKAIHSDAFIKPMWEVTIPAEGWVEAEPEEVEFPYCIEVEYDGVLDTHNAEVTVDRESINDAWTCGLCPTMETMHNKLKFWARTIPTKEIMCHMTLFGAGGVSGGDTVDDSEA